MSESITQITNQGTLLYKKQQRHFFHTADNQMCYAKNHFSLGKILTRISSVKFCDIRLRKDFCQFHYIDLFLATSLFFFPLNILINQKFFGFQRVQKMTISIKWVNDDKNISKCFFMLTRKITVKRGV